MSWAERFLFDNAAPTTIDGTGLQADPETIARVRMKQGLARVAMGTKWVGHLRHTGYATRAQVLRDWDEALTENAGRYQATVVRFQRRTT